MQSNFGSLHPLELWENAAKEVFDTKSSQEKGLANKIPKGSYTKSVSNKKYAIIAVEILKQNKHTTFLTKELWEKLELGNKRSNSQMDVFLALWENGMVVK